MEAYLKSSARLEIEQPSSFDWNLANPRRANSLR
jgi:hypothetical protein